MFALGNTHDMHMCILDVCEFKQKDQMKPNSRMSCTQAKRSQLGQVWILSRV